MRSTGYRALLATILLGLSLTAAAYQKTSIAQAHDGTTSFIPVARAQSAEATPTAAPSATPTVPPLPTPTSSVSASATTVTVGETLTVYATSNLGLPRYYLTIFDASTGQEQSQTSPIFSPAKPDPIQVSYGAVSWSLTAVRSGTVYFGLGVSGEVCARNLCTWGYSGARSGNVQVIDAPTPDPSITPTPTASPGCAVRYAVNQWGTGFTANITIANTSAAPLDSWTLAWAFGGDQQISNAWNAAVTQTGSSVVAKSMPYNASIAAGGSTSFGFQASYSGSNAAPASFTLNGAACDILP
ncbi:hypothetical protein F8S13_02535 [Chloroflexia bacterium SDU3-3]|nr:hypothetical protein F8S13_02535 [Chloroflexia bacterium SDU3-3]